MLKYNFCLLFFFISIGAIAQSIPRINDIPDYFAPQQKEELASKKKLLIKHKDLLKNKIDTFNIKCEKVPLSKTSLIDECEKAQIQFEKERRQLIVGIIEFNNLLLSKSDSFFAFKEQKNLAGNFEVWISNQHAKVEEAVKADSNLTKEMLRRLKGFSPPESTFQPQGTKDLKNGDVLLMFPKTAGEKIIDWADKFYNSYTKDEGLKASHALVFIGRDASGRGLFLNNTSKSYLHPDDNPGGPRIIGQTEFEQLYGERDYNVARPRAIIDGINLLKTAKEMHIKASNKIQLIGSEFGVLGNDMVCSEISDMIIARATGRQIIDKKKFIDVSPNNFFDKQDVGRYYIISPVIKQK